MVRVFPLVGAAFGMFAFALLLQSQYNEWRSVYYWTTNLLSFGAAWLGLNVLLVGICSAHDASIRVDNKWSWLSGKNPVTGSFNPLLFLFWFPFWVALQFYVHVIFRRIRHLGKPVVTHIHSNWYLGGWPHRTSILPAELQSHNFILVDMTCELPRMVGKQELYFNIPAWDGTGPSRQAFNDGVKAVVAKQQATRLPVLIHCGFGRGRSFTFLLACLVQAGLFKCWEDAHAHVLARRPIVHLPRALKPLLIKWALLYEETGGGSVEERK